MQQRQNPQITVNCDLLYKILNHMMVANCRVPLGLSCVPVQIRAIYRDQPKRLSALPVTESGSLSLAPLPSLSGLCLDIGYWPVSG